MDRRAKLIERIRECRSFTALMTEWVGRPLTLDLVQAEMRPAFPEDVVEGLEIPLDLRWLYVRTATLVADRPVALVSAKVLINRLPTLVKQDVVEARRPLGEILGSGMTRFSRGVTEEARTDFTGEPICIVSNAVLEYQGEPVAVVREEVYTSAVQEQGIKGLRYIGN